MGQPTIEVDGLELPARDTLDAIEQILVSTGVIKPEATATVGAVTVHSDSAESDSDGYIICDGETARAFHSNVYDAPDLREVAEQARDAIHTGPSRLLPNVRYEVEDASNISYDYTATTTGRVLAEDIEAIQDSDEYEFIGIHGTHEHKIAIADADN